MVRVSFDIREELPEGELDDPGYQRLLGDMSAEKDRLGDAIHHYRKAVDLDEQAAESHSRLADAYFAGEMYRNAYRAHLRAVKANPNCDGARFALAEFLRSMGKLHAAIAEYEQACHLSPRRAYYQFRLAEAHAEAGWTDSAVTAFKAAIELAPGDGFYHYKMGKLHFSLQQTGAAIAALRRAAECAPLDDLYHVWLGIACLRAGRWQDAVEVLQRTVRIRPRNACYHYLLAHAYCRSGQEQLAASHFRRAGHLDYYDRDYVARAMAHAGQAADVL